MKKKGTAEPITAEAVLDLSIKTLYVGLIFIENEIEKIQKGTAKKSRHDSASRIAFLTQRVGAIADSVRKVESARHKRISELSKALVLSWFREMDQVERAQFVRELQTIDSKRSGLA